MEKSNGLTGMSKQVICGVIVILIAGWITYVSVKGITLDAMLATVSTRVAVLETVTTTIKDDVKDIKDMLKEVRDDQRRRYVKEVREEKFSKNK